MRFPALGYLCQLLLANVRKSAWILCLCLLGVSCLEQPDCFNLINNTLNISYRKISDGALDTVAIESVSIVGLDSVFSSTVRGVTVPLDFTVNSVSVVLDQADKTRLLDIGYKVQPQFVSEECGPRFGLSNLSISSPSGDSVRVLSGTPGGTGSHVAVYRCPRNNVVRLAFRQNAASGEIRDTLGITSTAVDFEPIFYYPVTGAALNFINLPLNVASTSTQVTLELADPVRTATLTFTYEIVNKTVYKICGEQPFIRNVQVSADIVTIKSISSINYKTDSIYDPPKINFALFQ